MDLRSSSQGFLTRPETCPVAIPLKSENVSAEGGWFCRVAETVSHTRWKAAGAKECPCAGSHGRSVRVFRSVAAWRRGGFRARGLLRAGAPVRRPAASSSLESGRRRRALPPGARAPASSGPALRRTKPREDQGWAARRQAAVEASQRGERRARASRWISSRRESVSGEAPASVPILSIA